MSPGRCWNKGSAPPDVQMKDIGQLVRWVPEPILAQEGLPLVTFMEVLMEVEKNGTMLVQKDDATLKDDAISE